MHGKMTAVQSSNIAGIDYDWSGTLTIEFHSGGVYEYFDVPHSTYVDLMQAESHGKYFHAHIRNRFRYRKLN